MVFAVFKNFLDELFSNEQSLVGEENRDARKIQIVPPQSQLQSNKTVHTRITFTEGVVNKKKSVLERLGKRSSDKYEENNVKRTKIATEEDDDDKKLGRIVSVVRKPEVVTKSREVTIVYLNVLILSNFNLRVL